MCLILDEQFTELFSSNQETPCSYYYIFMSSSSVLTWLSGNSFVLSKRISVLYFQKQNKCLLIN
jgi:hypothetical protein